MPKLYNIEALQDGDWPISRRENRALYGHNPLTVEADLEPERRIRAALLRRAELKQRQSNRTAHRLAKEA